MKKAKRLVSLLLALVMLMSLAIGVGAAGECLITVNDAVTQGEAIVPTGTPNKGSITINNPAKDEKYNLYQILYLDSYSPAEGTTNATYSYKATTAWATFLQTDEAKKYLQTDVEGHVTWVGNTPMDGSPKVVEFAKLAQAWAADPSHNINPVATATAENPTGDTTEYDSYVIKFTNLNLGYYLLDTSMGALCSLNTLSADINMTEKNTVPETTKQVQENSNVGTSTEWGDKNDAWIGDTINYSSEIRVKRDCSNLIFHDEMTVGLTFNYNAATEWDNNGKDMPDGKVDNLVLNLSQGGASTKQKLVQYTGSGDEALYDYKVTVSDNKFDITFLDGFYKRLTAVGDNGGYVSDNWVVYVTYSAILNENAVVGDTGNINKCYATYGDKNHSTAESTTKTQTWEFKAMKYAQQGTEKKPLDGAQFKLYRNEQSDNGDGKIEKETTQIYYNFIEVENCNADSEQEAVYRIAKEGETGSVDHITTNKSGKFTIKGLDSATYNLIETVAPKNYNPLSGPVRVVINKQGEVTGNAESIAAGEYVYILNNSGAVLPSTGGIGTTIFYVAGSILLIGAAVLLIVKKRMSNEK